MGNGNVVDSMVHDGLWDVYNDYHMGVTGENVAEKHSITREEQDRYALDSHRKRRGVAGRPLRAPRSCQSRSRPKEGRPPDVVSRDESFGRMPLSRPCAR